MTTRLALLAALFGGLLVALVLLPPSTERLPPLSVYSAEPGGGRALRLWLDALGYDVATIENSPYRVPSGTATVLLLAPTRPVGPGALDELERWVREGGTLVVAADGLLGGVVLGRFGLGLRALPSTVATAVPVSGSGLLDPAVGEVTVNAAEELVPAAEMTVWLAGGGDGERVFGGVVPLGAGRVVALSAPAALSNRALHRADNARLALSVVGPGSRGSVVFDELHHGFGVAEPRSLVTLLLDRAWGWAALYAGLLVLAYLALRGRRFGRPRPILVSRGRSLAEYVTSLASLYRAGGKRGWVAEHFRHRLRRDLAAGIGLPADAPDDQIVARARALGRDPSAALGVLRSLDRARAPSEVALVALVREGERAVTSGTGPE